MKYFFSLFFVLVGTVHCATVHNGPVGESKDQKVKISAQRNAGLSDKYYLFYEMTLENTTNEWQEIQIKKVQFEDQGTELLYGDKLASWIEGAELKLKASDYNKDLLLGSMMAVGAVAAVSSNNSSVQTAGVLTAAAGAVGGTASPDISSEFVVRFMIRNLAGDLEGFLTEATSKQVVAGKKFL